MKHGLGAETPPGWGPPPVPPYVDQSGGHGTRPSVRHSCRASGAAGVKLLHGSTGSQISYMSCLPHLGSTLAHFTAIPQTNNVCLDSRWGINGNTNESERNEENGFID